MIKQTFYNLQEEKKRRILEAAKLEFSKVPLHDAKISNIVSTSKIPRGSFYQYFDTLNDVFIAMMQDIEQKKITILNQLVHKATGNIFKMAILMFEHEYRYFKKMNHQLLLNIFKLSEMEEMYSQDVGTKFQDTNKMEFLNHLDFSGFNTLKQEEIFLIVQMIFNILSEAVRISITKGYSLEMGERLFSKQLEYIKYGVLNRKEA